MVFLTKASISNGFWDIQRRMYRSGWRDLDTTSTYLLWLDNNINCTVHWVSSASSLQLKVLIV